MPLFILREKEETGRVWAFDDLEDATRALEYSREEGKEVVLEVETDPERLDFSTFHRAAESGLIYFLFWENGDPPDTPNYPKIDFTPAGFVIRSDMTDEWAEEKIERTREETGTTPGEYLAAYSSKGVVKDWWYCG